MRPAVPLRRVCLAAAAVVLGAGGALAHDAWQAAEHLRDAEAGAARVRSLLAQGDADGAERELSSVRRDTSAARDRLTGPLWTAASAVPWLGRTPAAARDGATTVDAVSRQVLPALADTLGALSAPTLRPAGNRIDLDVLRALLPELRAADTRLRQLSAYDPQPGVLGPVADRRIRLAEQLEELSSAVHRATVALELLPAALGGSGPREYFLAFQNPSESRGTGGIVGAYAILAADDGVITLPVISDNRDLYDLPPSRIDLGVEHRRLYGRATVEWANTNLSPHFPYAARAWIDSWEQQTGRRLDGAVATDPVGLSHLLRALGTVRLPDGTEVTSENVVRRTGWDAYTDFDGRTDARKDFLVTVARAVVGDALSGTASASDLADALARAAVDGRLRAFSMRSDEQQALAGTVLAGELPSTPAPLAAVIVNNMAGNKLDYHLRRELTYELARCGPDRRRTVVRVVLTNAVPEGRLAPYASARLDLADGERYEIGSNRLQVALYATTGAALQRLTVDGVRTPVAVGSERGHPVFALPVALARGQSRVLEFLLQEPRSSGAPRLLVQPLIDVPTTHLRVARCA